MRSPQSTGAFDSHVFQPDPDGDRDWRNNLVDCSACPFPEGNAVHVSSEVLVQSLPPNPPEAREIDARIMGET